MTRMRGGRPRRGTALTARRGQAMIEFAIILPLLVLLVGGGVDFGLFMFEREQAGSCARAVARRAAVRTSNPASTGAVPQCTRAASKTTISISYKNEAGTTSYTASNAPNGSNVIVSIDYPYPAIFLSLALPINNTTFTPLTMLVKATTTMRMEGQPS